MGGRGGVEHLQSMFSGTFLAMLAVVPFFRWCAGYLRHGRCLPCVLLFFHHELAAVFALFKSDLTDAYVARAFFIWTSVFNLFIVSVFLELHGGYLHHAQAKRLFGVIAAGGNGRCPGRPGPDRDPGLAVGSGQPAAAFCGVFGVGGPVHPPARRLAGVCRRPPARSRRRDVRRHRRHGRRSPRRFCAGRHSADMALAVSDRDLRADAAVHDPGHFFVLSAGSHRACQL